MNLPDTFKSLSEKLQSTATVKTVYGDPIEAEGKTVLPVARVRYGFGAGGGTTGPLPSANGEDGPDGDEPASGGAQSGAGEGGGGGVEVTPVGVIEITPDETRFISFEDRRGLIKAGLIGLLVGLFLLRRRLRG